MSEINWMQRALELAAKGLYTTKPNPRVGCVLVKDDVIVGEGWHQFSGGPHAEIEAIKMAGEKARGATCYVTLEPCSHFGKTGPCTKALIEAGVTRVVAAMQDPNPLVAGAGFEELELADIRCEVGLMELEACELNPGFIKKMTQHRPWVRVKLGVSLDGRTALANGESQWITSPEAREDVQKWRAQSAAIITGTGTVLSDNPSLNVRLENVSHQPVRVVLDSNGKTPFDARMLSLAGKTWIITKPDVRWFAQNPSNDIAHVNLPASSDGHIDLDSVLDFLAEQKIDEVLVEAGPTLAGAFISAGLVDELIIYTAPKFMGQDAREMAKLPLFTQLKNVPEFDFVDVKQMGPDVRLILRPRGTTCLPD